MEDNLGIGKSVDVKSGCVPAGCNLSTQSAAGTEWCCTFTHCPLYHWCPATCTVS